MASGQEKAGDVYWSAAARRAVPAVPVFAGEVECDVAIIGGGFTGLSALHHLTEAGADCLLLEAGEIGRGASGRTAGMAGTRYKKGWAAMAAAYGAPTARHLHAMMAEAYETLEGLLTRYGAHDVLHRRGQLIPAHTEEALDSLASDAEWLAREVGEQGGRILDRVETERESGAQGYRGAWLDPRGGAVQPVELLRALWSGLLERRARLFVGSPVTAIDDRGGEFLLTTPGGRVKANRLLLATNAYTPPRLVKPDLSRHLVPVASSIVVTAPLSKNLAGSVLPNGLVASDTMRLLHAFRKLPDDRLLFSGRADISGRHSDRVSSYQVLERAMVEVFPQLGDTAVEYRWAGYVGVSRDGFPHVGRLGDRIVYAMGYSGRGVVLSHLLGKYAARMSCGESVPAGPMEDAGLRRWPFHQARVPAMRVAAWLYKHQDRRDVLRAQRR
ncbi:MAG: FAD-dependent oxidoreductase [Tistlia sp.]